MSDKNSSFKITLQAMLDKIKSIANIKADIKAIEAKLPKIKIQGTLDKTATSKEIKAKIKDVKPKVKVDADTTNAVKKIKKLEKQKTKTVIQTETDNSQVVSGIKEAQKETKTLWERFTSGITGINLIQIGVQKIVQTIHQAIVNIKELDAIKTNIQMVSGTSNSEVNAMMGSYNSMAKELSSTTKDVASAANEFLRMGESIETTNELIKSSQVLSKIGMIESSDAANYLISSLKGYQVAAKDSMDIVSKLTAVDMEAAVSAGGLSEALSKCANIANNSGISMDRLIGYTATVGEITQKSMSEVGNSFQSLLSRMSNIKIGRFIDDETGESLSDTEAVLNKLGIRLRETEDTYRDFDEVLDDVGSRWKDFTKVEQNAISVAIAGTRQRENFEALMNNWANALKYSETAANSAGSALERYGVYQDSIEAKTNELTAAIESLSTSAISEELYSGIIAATTNIVEFIDKANLLKGTLAGLVTMGVSKTFVSIASSIISASRSTAQLTAAMKLFDNGRSSDNLRDIGAACKGLSEKQLKLVLSTKGLINEDRKLILEGMGVKEQEQEQTLATLGFAAAEDKATASTFSLKGAWNALSASFAANPVGFVLTAISALVTIIPIATSVVSSHNQKLAETRQKAAELADTYKQQQSSLDSQIKKYKELKESLDSGNLSTDEARSIKEQLLEIQNSLVDSYGTEASNIDLLNGKYKEQIGLLSELSKQKAEDFIIENRDVFDNAKEQLEKVKTYDLGTVTSWSNYAPKTEEQQALLDYIEAYSDFIELTYKGGANTSAVSISVKADVQNADEVMHQFAKDLKKYGETNGIDVSNILDRIPEQLRNTWTDELKEYKSIYDEYMKAAIVSDDKLRPLYKQSIEAVEDYNNALSSGEGIAEAKANLDSLQQSVQNATVELEGSQIIFDGIFDGINKNAEAAYQLSQAFENDSTIQKFAEQLRGLSDIDIKAINLDNENIEKGEEAFRGLLETLGYTEPTEEQIQSLIDKLVELGYVVGETKNTETPYEIFSTFTNSDFGTRIQHITDLFNEGTISHKEYFDALQSEIDNFDASNFTNSIEDMNKASAQFFVDSMQQAADGLSGLINSFDKGEMSISEYLEGYLAIGNTLSTLTDNLQENSAAWNEHGEAISEVGNTALDDTQNKLSSAMSIIESYQDSIYSLEQIMNDAVTVGSDEFTAHANVIAEDLYRIVQTGGEMADTIANTLGTTTSEIAQSLTENVSNQEIACQAIMANTNNAITDMASSIGELFDTLGDAISNFKVDLSFEKTSGNIIDAILGKSPLTFSLNASGESLSAIGSAISNFGKTIASNYTPQTIELEDFHFGSTDAAKDRKYSPSSGITKNYEDALGRIKDATKSSSSAAKSEFSEMVDFFKRRIDELDDALSLLKTNLDNISGSFAKNNLVDAQLNITEEKFNNYTDALAMYTQKANEALSKLPADIAAKVKDGAVALTDFIGDGNKDVVEAIKEYESWAGEISTCQKELAELRTTIRQLELEKFNNIMDDYQNAFNLRGNSKDLISKQIDLLKEAGELIGESFFKTQIDQSQKQLELLENEKAQLINQMSSAINSGRIQKGTDEWLSMVNALSDVDGSILDCKKSIEEFSNSILEIHTQIFDRIQEQFSNLNSEISNIIDLFDEFDVSDEKGIWSKEAIAQLGLLTQQYELAQYQVQQYNNEIDELNKQYLAGRYSATEYADKLASLTEEQWSAVKASESAKDALIDLNEVRVENQIKGIQKEIDSFDELTQSQIKALKSSKELHDYENSIAEKTKSIIDLERQISAMQNDTSAATVAKRKKLEEQLAEAKKDLEEAEYAHSIEVSEDALNAQFEQYEKERNDEIEALRASLNDKENILAESFATVKENASLVGQEIATIATEHGVTVSNALISSWQSGEMAIASYGEVLSQGTSAFIGNIMGVENEVWNLQAQANVTADSLAWMFSTRADNLVNELTTSYYAESNLANMTNALQQSLVNTLERGYDVSSIVNSLASVESAANSAKAAIDRMNSASSASTNTASKNLTGTNKTSSNNLSGTYAVSPMSGKVLAGPSLQANYIDPKLKKYASGTQNAEDEIRIVDEKGKELILTKLSSGRYDMGNKGDQIFTKEQTDRLYELANTDNRILLPGTEENLRMVFDMHNKARVPEPVIDRKMPAPVTNHYDSMFAFNGAVIDAERALKQMEKVAGKIADQRIDKHDNKMYDAIKYRRY